MTDSSSDFAVGQHVRVYPGSRDEHCGVVVEDFGDSAGHAVTIGDPGIAEPSRRWAINLDDGTLVFANTTDLEDLEEKNSSGG